MYILISMNYGIIFHRKERSNFMKETIEFVFMLALLGVTIWLGLRSRNIGENK